MERVRAVIIEDNKVLVIRRTKANEVYWVLPGGGVEDAEAIEQALVREGKEELGLELKVGNLITTIKSDKEETTGQDEYFYQCEIAGGRLGSGNRPEFQKSMGYKGSYDFEWIDITELDKYDLRPEEIKKYVQKI